MANLVEKLNYTCIDIN